MTRTEQVVNHNNAAAKMIENAAAEGMMLEDIDAMVEGGKLEVLRDISVSLAMIVDLIGGKVND